MSARKAAMASDAGGGQEEEFLSMEESSGVMLWEQQGRKRARGPASQEMTSESDISLDTSRRVVKKRTVERSGEFASGSRKKEEAMVREVQGENGKQTKGGEEKLDRTLVVEKELVKIVESVSRETGGKISVTRVDQGNVKDSAGKIQRELLDILRGELGAERRIKELENDNRGLRARVAELERELKGRRSERMMVRGAESSTDSDMVKVQRTKRQRRTYAEVMAVRGKEGVNVVNSGNKIEGRVVVAGVGGWKTPPSTRQAERALVVTSKAESNARKLANELATTIKAKDIGGPPKGMRTIRDGKLIILAKDKEQQGKIRESLVKNKNLEVRERKAADPMLVVSGVERGMTDEDFAGKILRGTEELAHLKTEDIRIVKRVTCRNAWKENIVLRLDLPTFKLMVKKGKVEIDCQRYFVEEYLGLAMCYRCCRFGHVTTYCKEKTTCHSCAGEHDGRDCNKEVKKCVNCWRVFGKFGDHSARNPDCPAMMRILEKSRSRINYNGRN